MSASFSVRSEQSPGRIPAGYLREILSPWRGTLAFVLGCVFAGAGIELIPPLLVRRIVDDHLARGVQEGLLGLALLYLAAAASAQFAQYLVTYFTAVAAQGALRDLRVRLFAHLQRLPPSRYDQTPLGDIISRCTADVDTIDTLFSSGVVLVVTNLARLASIAVAMIVLSPLLSLLSFVVFPPLALVTRYCQIRVREAERATRRAVGQVNSCLQETLGGVEVIRAFAREDAFAARFCATLREMLLAFNRSTIYSALFNPVVTVLAAGVTSALLWAGGRNALTGWSVSLGTLTAFVLLFQRFFKPVTDLGESWQTVQSALAGLERVSQTFAWSAEERALAPGAEDERHSSLGATVTLNDVTFGYRPGRPVLHGLTFSVRRGEHVAIVGRTGAGKSSLLHLLSGLYEPWSGRIDVAGRPPRSLAEDERRGFFGVVPQTVQLFSGTIWENLTMSDAAVGRAAVERAAAISGADGFIRALPQGYETPLSSGGRGTGVQLSAGQRQLLALTRALVWDPPLLLLDEATAAVDGRSDAAFRAALRPTVSNGRSVLTVAHRLSTAREADRVVVMEAGRIVEEGPPEELIRRGGRFAALLELEAAGWDWRGEAAEPDSEGA